MHTPNLQSARWCVASNSPTVKLIPDPDFRRDFLNNCTRRTGKWYDKQGLPYIIVNGVKMRPIKRGQHWIASRIVTRHPRPRLRGR